MKFVDEYRDPELGKKLLERIHRTSHTHVRLMEFCGGHTVAIFKHGLRQLLPTTVEMLSGPGCPVCVTASADLDKAIAIAQLPDVIITSFGDMVRVPGSRSSLQQAKAEGAHPHVRSGRHLPGTGRFEFLLRSSEGFKVSTDFLVISKGGQFKVI